MSANLVLPKIPQLHPLVQHPHQRKGDSASLAVRGMSRSSSRPRSTPASSAVLPPGPSPSPSPLSTREKKERAMKLVLDEVVEKVSSKLRGPHYYTVRHAFRVFDPQGQGNVTRQALFRIMYNQGMVGNQMVFQALLDRLNLAQKDVIPFSDFYSKFHGRPQSCPHWMDPVTRHSPRTMTANQVAVFLKERAKQRLLLSELFPFRNGPPHSVSKPEFSNMVSSLSVTMDTEEMEKLWRKLDPKGDGCISIENMLRRLGVTFSPQCRKDTPPDQSTLPALPALENDGRKSLKQLSETERYILKNLHGNWGAVARSLQELDQNDTGKVRLEELRQVLQVYGVPATLDQIHQLLGRLGLRGTGAMVQYKDFLKLFMDRSQGSVTDAVMTSTQPKPTLPHGRACTSVGDVEARLVGMLQGKFLKLVSAFKSHDPRGRGLLRKNVFLQCVEEVLGKQVVEGPQLVEDVGEFEPGWIAYPKFLAKFQEPLQEEANPALVAMNDLEPRPLTHVDIPLVESIQKVIRANPQAIYELLEDIDQQNVGKLKLAEFKALLSRLGIKHTDNAAHSVWSTVLKDKYGGVDHHEFIRHFMGRTQTGSILPTPQNWSEDHCFLRSLRLHRDEDMVLDKLKANVRYFYSSLLKHLQREDSSGSGGVTAKYFQSMLKELCPELSDTELLQLSTKFTRADGLVDYSKFLQPLRPSNEVYRTGNNLTYLLSHRQGNRLTGGVIPPLTAPQWGIPGAAAILREKIGRNWRHLQRSMSRADPEREGALPTKVFFDILQSNGIQLLPQQQIQVQEVLDPGLTDTINYHEFFKAFLG